MVPNPDARPLDACTYVGGILLAGFVVQAMARLDWPWLSALQAGDAYAQISGFALLGLITHQWHLAATRSRGLARAAAGLVGRHKLLGATAPLFFYAHSQHMGFAYLETLSITYLAVSSIGLLQSDLAPVPKAWQALWTIAHVGLATALPFLVGYHVFISYAYE